MSRRIIFSLLVLLLSVPLFAQLSTGDQFAVAIERHDAEKVQALIDGGASADTWIEYGEHKITPLMKAAWEGDGDIIDLLLKAGAKVNAKATDDQQTALMNAVKRDRTEIVQTLLKAGADITPKDSYGYNAFTSAVAAGNVEIAGILLDAGAKINDGAHTLTPLQFAVSAGSEEMVRFLVKRGADVNYGAKSGGQTALLSAIYSAKPDMVKLLIQLKADVNTKTKDGDTPLSAAQKGDQDDIIQILKSAGAKK